MAIVSLGGNADAVEFCPTEPFHHILVASTYNLLEGLQSSYRTGTLTLFSLSDGGGLLQLQKRQVLESSGILDIKWNPCPSACSPILAQAAADGSLCLLEMEDTCFLRELARKNVSTAMCLSIDWDPHSGQNLAMSISDGQVLVVNMRESLLEVQQTNRAHGFEAWCVAYDAWRSNVIYTGGDDCHFCGWDFRKGLFQSIFRDKKTHSMGVCSIQGNLHREHILATGSYDERLRLWDVRMLEKPLLDNALGLGGGVWKLKWNPCHGGLLAAACMHNGVALVEVKDDGLHTLFEYKKHESLAYGVDWCKGPLVRELDVPNATYEHRERFVLATCSFYDHSLHVWEHSRSVKL